MIPGVPFETDDSLDLRAMGAAIKAIDDVQKKFARSGQRLVSLRVWKGKLIAEGTGNQAYVYYLPCQKCRDKQRGESAGV